MISGNQQLGCVGGKSPLVRQTGKNRAGGKDSVIDDGDDDNEISIELVFLNIWQMTSKEEEKSNFGYFSRKGRGVLAKSKISEKIYN